MANSAPASPPNIVPLLNNIEHIKQGLSGQAIHTVRISIKFK